MQIYRKGNKVTIASTQSGKSYAEAHDVLAAATVQPPMGIVVTDPHSRSLARNALHHLVSRGQSHRIIWDELDELERTPKYRFLTRSRAANLLLRAKENHQQAEQFTELLCRRREQQSLAASGWENVSARSPHRMNSSVADSPDGQMTCTCASFRCPCRSVYP